MKRIGAVIVGLLFVAVAAAHAADGDQGLSMEPFRYLITAAKEIKRAAASGVVGGDLRDGKPSRPVEFVAIDGGQFWMGTNTGVEDTRPVHSVAVKTFEISATPVTVEQYAECVVAGQCAQPDTGSYCNWGVNGRQRHPINCVSWKDANDFAKFKGARLPSEAEYEYAATGRGKNWPYPWGKDKATCEKAVMYENGRDGCGGYGTSEVCSKLKGNTKQGLCDIVGNVLQWVEDRWHDSYMDAPTDGSAWEDGGSFRVARGGAFDEELGGHPRGRMEVHSRSKVVPENRRDYIGFRLARTAASR